MLPRDIFNRVLPKILAEKKFQPLNNKDAQIIAEAMAVALRAEGKISPGVICEILKEKDED